MYLWYARNGGATATYEFALSTTHKLHRDGRLFDLTTDPFEEKPLPASARSAATQAEVKKLQAVLDRYAQARPKHLADHVSATAAKAKQKKKAGKTNE
jgi:hypothetical protein